MGAGRHHNKRAHEAGDHRIHRRVRHPRFPLALQLLCSISPPGAPENQAAASTDRGIAQRRDEMVWRGNGRESDVRKRRGRGLAIAGSD